MEAIELYLTNYKHFIQMLPVGEGRAKKAHELYGSYIKALQLFDEKYNDPGMLIKEETFTRQLRKLSEDARRAGIKVINSNNGFAIAENNEEWEKFKTKESRRAGSVLEQLALCEGKSLTTFLRDIFFKQKAMPISDKQLNIFEL